MQKDFHRRAGFVRQKKAEEDVTFCLIKDRTFFTRFCLTNPTQRNDWRNDKLRQISLSDLFIHHFLYEKGLNLKNNVIRKYFKPLICPVKPFAALPKIVALSLS
jgi:hypothetical protein